MLGREGQILDVLGSEGWKNQSTLGKVDPFVRTQPDPAETCTSDEDEYLALIHFLDHAADLTVVEPNRFTGLDTIEHLRNRAPDRRRHQKSAAAVVACSVTRLVVASQDESISLLQSWDRIQGLVVRVRVQPPHHF